MGISPLAATTLDFIFSFAVNPHLTGSQASIFLIVHHHISFRMQQHKVVWRLPLTACLRKVSLLVLFSLVSQSVRSTSTLGFNTLKSLPSFHTTLSKNCSFILLDSRHTRTEYCRSCFFLRELMALPFLPAQNIKKSTALSARTIPAKKTWRQYFRYPLFVFFFCFQGTSVSR